MSDRTQYYKDYYKNLTKAQIKRRRQRSKRYYYAHQGLCCKRTKALQKRKARALATLRNLSGANICQAWEYPPMVG